MKKLTNKEIEEFANRPGAKKIAAENFLMSIGEEDDLNNTIRNLLLDAKSYSWNKETIETIIDGILEAAELDKETNEIILISNELID